MEKKILIQDILLKMNYDLSKTLSENKEIILEQGGYYYTPAGQLVGYPGTNNSNIPAKEIYPNITNNKYPQTADFGKIQTALAGRNINKIVSQMPKTTTNQSTPFRFEKPQIPQSDVLGPQGSFPKSLGVDKKSIEMKAEYAAIPEPKEYTKKLSKERYDEFISERKRISKLPPSLKWTEYNKKLSEAFQEFRNYDKKFDTYYSAQQQYDSSSEYLTALYYPEQWKKDNVKGPDTHDVLLLVAVGVFAIPLLLAAAGASAVVVGAATTGAMVVSSSADVADAVLYLEDGDLEMAGLSAIFALLPFVPNLARFGKGVIKNAVTGYSKGAKLTTEELKVIEELSKEETQKLLKEAAEKQAASKMTPEMTKTINKVTAELENKITKKSILKSPTINFLGTLAGFYLVGQGYHKAVESYKKSHKSVYDIYEILVKQGKISLSWNDLKWVFGSDGSVLDNQKLGAALLSGYNGENSNEWLYKNADFRTKTWTNKWLPIHQEELNKQKYQTDVITSLSKDNSLENRQKAKQFQKEKILTDENGIKRTEDDFKKIADEILSDKDLFDINKPFKTN
jgi:hypothetical protein